MDYVEKARKLSDHIKEHPTDYQAQIALLIAKSDAIEHEKHMAMIEKKKDVAKYRRMLDEKRKQHIGNR